MNLRRDRRLARSAAADFERERTRFRRRSAQLRDDVEPYRPTALVVGGLLTGWLIGRRHLVGAVRASASAIGLLAGLMRSRLAPLAIATILSRRDTEQGRSPGSRSQG